MSFPCACAFSVRSFIVDQCRTIRIGVNCPKIKIWVICRYIRAFVRYLFFYVCFQLKNIILFCKNVRSCAAEKRMKMTLEKKLDNVSHFLAPVRFQSHLSALLKSLISIEKYHFI